MKKFFTLMTLLVALCSGAWADEWSIDFSVIGKNHGLTDKYGASISAMVFHGTTDFGTVTLGEALNPNFGIQTGTSWIYRTGSKGLYSSNSGGRSFGINNAKANQIITINVDDAPAPTNATAISTEGNIRKFKVTADGVVSFNLARYKTIYTISIEDPALTDVNYTYKFVDASNKELKPSSTNTGAPGADVSISDTQKESFVADGKKYIYVSDDAAGKKIAADGSTVVTVKFREAAVYNYSAKTSLGDVIYTGSGMEGDAASYYFPRFIQKNGKLYEVTGNTYFQGSITLDANNKVATVNYNESSINCAYYSEAEDIKGITAYEDGFTNIRMSNGKVGYAPADGTVITTIPAGKYKLTSSTRSASNGIKFFIGDVEALNLVSSGAVEVKVSDEILITEPKEVTVAAGSKTHYFDYVLIEKTGEYIPATGITVSTETPSINISQKAAISATVSPDNATITDVEWSTSNANIATVDASGYVTPVTSGSVTIYAKDHLGHTASQVIDITPLKALVAIKDAPKADAQVIVGATKESNDKAANGEYVTITTRAGWEGLQNTTQLSHSGSVWASEYNTSIYEIIINDIDGDKEATKSITCIYTPDIEVEEMKMETESQLLVEGNERITNVQYFPADATFQTAVWSSSDVSIAVVNPTTGKVTAVSPGICVITAAWSANAEHGKDIKTSYTLNVLPKHTFDFLSLSDETLANLKADSQWEADKDGKSYGAFFKDYSGEPAPLKANDKEIQEFSGIKFVYPVEGQLGIAVNKGNNGENIYNGTQYLALTGLAPQIILHNVVCGSPIAIGMESQYNTDYSQVQLEVNGERITKNRAWQTGFGEYKWVVPGTEADGVVDVVIRNYTSIGANIYYINCEINNAFTQSITTSVENAEAATAAPAKILTKTGIKVKGYSVDGKK